MSWPNSTAGIKTIVIILSFVFLFIVAVLLDLQYLYLMAVTLAVLPLASYGLAYFGAASFDVERQHPATATEGRPISVLLQISTRGGVPQGALRVSDAIPEMLRPQATPSGPTPLDTWNGESGERTYLLDPQKRGVYSLGPTTIETTDPLGLFNFAFASNLETEIVIHPQPIAAPHTSVGGEGQYGLRERDGKTRQGVGMDFHGVREYRIGDPLRRVHWPTTARTGKLSVIEFERAYQQSVVIGLDRSRAGNHGTGRESTIEYGIKIAATLIDRTLAAGGGITFVSQGCRFTIRPGADDVEASRFRIFDILARLNADADESLSEELMLARTSDGAYFAIITAQGDPRLSAYLSGRIRHGDGVRLYFIEPTSFGGEQTASPAVEGGELRVISKEHDPWLEGGRNLEYLLREAR